MSAIGPGDLVQCVDAFGPVLRNGQIHRVHLVNIGPETGRMYIKTNISPKLDNGFGWYAGRFRKIDRADDEFTALIRKRQPVAA